MENLKNLVETLKEKAVKYHTVLSSNELMTRYVLVDPLLRELGWDLTDPDTVTMEESTPGKNRTDYKMGKTMIIEAKHVGTVLKKDMVEKYLQNSDVQYGVVTNGVQWNIYVKSKISPEYAFNLNDDTKSIISNAINLHRMIASEGVGEAGDDERGPKSKIPVGNVPISNIPHCTDPPTRLYFPDASSVKLNRWIDILASTVKWLADNKHLNETHCPIQYTPKSTIVNTNKTHSNGIPFKSYKQDIGCVSTAT